MIAAGAMKQVAAVVALHVDPDTPAGRLAYRQGVLTAFCQDLQVEIHGQGGHAARPHQSIDPIGVASQFITSVYQFVPRSVDSRSGRCDLRLDPGRNQRQCHPRAGTAEGNDPDPERVGHQPRGGANPADRLRPLGGQRRLDPDRSSGAGPTPWSTIPT